MTLNFGGNLFPQRDVRETPLESSAVTGTLYWSCPGCHFIAIHPDTDQVLYDGGFLTAEENDLSFDAGVFLPHGAIVTSAVVEGSAWAGTWSLNRIDKDGSGATMASGNADTADTSIINALIDNQNYGYRFHVSNVDTNEEINIAIITYTI